MSRSAVSTAYLIGTLTGALALPWIGRALDRYGIRRTLAVIGAVFGAVLISLATVSSIVGLTAGFVGIRMAGQGALGLTATTAAALWFDRRRGTATGIVNAAGLIPRQEVYLVRAASRRPPFPDATFDGVTAISTLEYVAGLHGDRQHSPRSLGCSDPIRRRWTAPSWVNIVRQQWLASSLIPRRVLARFAVA